MWDEVIRLVIGNGIWAVLFVVLFIYQLKDSRKREGKYVTMIDRLSLGLGAMGDIKADTKEIISKATGVKKDTESILNIVKKGATPREV